MVNLTIDGIALSVPEQTTILDAAAKAGVHIPTLCYWEGLNEIGACRVCVVEAEGYERLFTACNSIVEEGMVIHISVLFFHLYIPTAKKREMRDAPMWS